MIGYTLNLLSSASDECKIYYIDPQPSKYLDKYNNNVTYIEKPATEGVKILIDELITE